MGLDRAALRARRREPWGWVSAAAWAAVRPAAGRARGRPRRSGAAHPVGDPPARLACPGAGVCHDAWHDPRPTREAAHDAPEGYGAARRPLTVEQAAPLGPPPAELLGARAEDVGDGSGDGIGRGAHRSEAQGYDFGRSGAGRRKGLPARNGRWYGGPAPCKRGSGSESVFHEIRFSSQAPHTALFVRGKT
jgi:hypothetical protein